MSRRKFWQLYFWNSRQFKEEFKMFDIVKRFYDRKIYSAEDVKKFVLSGKITDDEYKEITGIDFE